MPIELKSGKTVTVAKEASPIRAVLNAAKAAAAWTASGFKTLSYGDVSKRKAICDKCPEWIPDARLGLGKCRVCKCTRLKLQLPNEKCPLDKWPAVSTKETLPKIENAKLWDGTDVDKILHWYRGHAPLARRPMPDLTGFGCTTNVLGLGDTVMLTDLAARGVPVYSASPHFKPLMAVNPGYSDNFDGRRCIDNSRLIYNYDCGPGHYTQKLSRAFGLPVNDKPQGAINVHMPKVKGRIVMHWEAGKHQEWQLKHLHPQARILYAQNRLVIEQFVRDHSDWEFIEVGRIASIRGAEPRLNLPLLETIKLISSADYFLGIVSGPMHLAAALNVRSVVIVNFPDANRMYLPTLVDFGQVEGEWHYPQNVHLHQDNDGPLVPRFSRMNLDRAFAGEIYPYWSEEFLPLIHEKL